MNTPQIEAPKDGAMSVKPNIETAGPATGVASGDLFGLMATANKLLQIQELMHRIHGDRYEERAAPWKRIIAAKAKHDGTSETAAAIALAKDSPSGPQALLILSSAVEMKSPNNLDQTRGGQRPA